MLVVSPLRCAKNERESQIQGFSMEGNEYPDFTSGNFLDSIDFDDLFTGISDGDLLPDLEMDPEILNELCINSAGENLEKLKEENNSGKSGKAASDSASDIGSGEEIVCKMEESIAVNPSPKEADKGRKSSAHRSKNPPGKKKVKVDWTPELHRLFVQAVEELGVDKAVPSRILELMGIDCLTRHNIASHLQKYRSHRKHLLAREAEAASWSQRRQIYGTAAVRGLAAAKREVNPWIAPSMGFPPVTPIPHFRPLHVWGHPSVDQSLMHMWPKHVAPPPPWPLSHPLPPSPPANSSFWHTQHQYKSPIQAVHGVPPPATYKVDPGQTLHPPPSDVHPSNESIDAAIGDVLAKPWLPLPLGLKSPSIDTVMVELKRQGVSKVPPSSCA